VFNVISLKAVPYIHIDAIILNKKCFSYIHGESFYSLISIILLEKQDREKCFRQKLFGSKRDIRRYH